MQTHDNKVYYLLSPSLRKSIDASTKNEKQKKSYFSAEQFCTMLETNSIFYNRLFYKDEYGIIREDYILAIADDCLEERLLELVEKSVLKVMMFHSQKNPK